MFQVLASAWALLLGVALLMVGNGLHGTLLGVRGHIEAFSTFEMSVVMSAYFLGFLGGSHFAPAMIRRVGHVRVFAALASLISAIMILFPVFPDPVAWALGRVVVGFCFSGVYVAAESWLNNAADNRNRGKALSLYMVAQMGGIVSAQGLLLVADPAGYVTFVIASVAISVSFAPILLSISPTPAYETAKPMTLGRIMGASPLGCVGMFLLGGCFAAMFGMSGVYGAAVGLGLGQLSAFVAAFYVGAMVMQYPLGWLSDRMDRRWLIVCVALLGAVGAGMGVAFAGAFRALLGAAFLVGGMVNPLYSLLLAYTNDYLEHEDMPAASGGLIFINGLGAVLGPLVMGWLMDPGILGPSAFFLFMATLLLAMVAYGFHRMTQRSSTPVEGGGIVQQMMPTVTPVAMELAQEVAIGADQDSGGPH